MTSRGSGAKQVSILDFQSRDSGANLTLPHQSTERAPAKLLKPDKPIKSSVEHLRLEVVHGQSIDFVKGLLNKYHYLPRHDLVGRQIYIKAFDSEPWDVVAVLSFSNPIAMNLGEREKWIDWSKEERLRNINHKMMHEARFLILPHVKVHNLASKILSLSCKIAKKEWKRKYGDDAVLVESFVDSRYYTGICYKAANFVYVGKTKGFSSVPTGKRTSMWAKQLYGENSTRSYQTLEKVSFPKFMFYLPLVKNWREELKK